MRAALENSGLQVRMQQVATRDGFLQEFRHEHPDVVLVDYSRTDGDGMQAALWSRNVSDKGGRVPVIFVTDPMGDEVAVMALKAGVHDYVLKQQLNRLPDAIRTALREREQKDAEMRSQVELQHAAEQIRENQKLVNMGRISGMITHEINNPLSAISNLLYLIRHEGSLSPNGLTYLDMAEREMERVVKISRQTLSFYREAKQPEALRPQELVEEVFSLYHRLIKERAVEIHRHYDFEGTITMFPGELRQVLSNIVVNAIEAMPIRGTLTVRVHAEHRWDDHSSAGVRIVVADNGAGIPADKLRMIGEPFFTTKGQNGTGLGLWVTQGIVRKYGGNMQVSSSTSPDHHGTVFSIFLPTEAAAQQQRPAAQPRHEASEQQTYSLISA